MFTERSRARRASLLGGLVLAVLVLLAVAPSPASAHAPDEYGHNTYLELISDGVRIEMHLTPGPLVGPRLADLIDSNRDGSFGDDEKTAYGNAIAKDLVVRVDDTDRPVIVTSFVVGPALDVRAGSAELVWTGIAAGSRPTSHVQFEDRHQVLPGPAQASLLDNGGLPSDLSIDRSVARGLGVTGTFSNTNVASTPDRTGSQAGDETSASPVNPNLPRTAAQAKGTKRLQNLLGSATSPGAMAVALGIAALLGALHALTPGHGKTIAGAYLVGEKATVRHAIVLGGSVTVTHTASVLLLGAVTISLADRIDPGTLATTLRWASGFLVVGIGLTLLVRRLRGASHGHSHGPGGHTHGHSHGHSHDPAHGHPHDAHDHAGHDHAGHDHAGHTHGPDDDANAHGHSHQPEASYDKGDHVHAYQPESKSTFRRLVTLGASGGLVPCPEALGVLIVAVSLRRQAFGMAMIVSFSLGLAAVLVAIGIALVRARAVMNRFTTLPAVVSEKWLPVLSALVVTLLGFAILSGHVV